MAHAYTPGLKVTEAITITKQRRLPILGEVLVNEGDHLDARTVVARAKLPGDPEAINAANKLNIDAEDVERYFLIGEGDSFEEGEVIARASTFFGLFRHELKAPFSGTLELMSSLTGTVTLRRPSVPVEIEAYIDGDVIEVLPNEGVVIQTQGALVQGIFGVGGERHGEIKLRANTPDYVLTGEDIDESCRDCIVIGGSLIAGSALDRAAEVGVAGLVAGGIIDEDLIKLLGYDIGVAITGQEDIPYTVIVTEGFGRIRMAEKTFELLTALDGERASINGATQIRAGVMRPEIIVAGHKAKGTTTIEGTEDVSQGLSPGTIVRIIREPWFGQIATVTGLPPELQVIESGAKVRVLRAELGSGEQVTIPRANVELIEG